MNRPLAALLIAITSATVAISAQLPVPQPAPGFIQPKTPWGDPDLQGYWPGVEMVGVPLQRPARFGTRNVLTDEEFAQRGRAIKEEEASLVAEIDVFTAEINPNCAIRCPTSPMPYWQETGKASRQASLIIDPPDGRQPSLSEEGQKRQADLQAAARARTERLQGREADTYLDRSLYDRCITRGFPGSMSPAIYGNAYDITQAPGLVAIRYEMIHETRIIPLDSSPRPNLQPFMGVARGHWEGDTLVVESTNFNERTRFRNASAKARLVERFTPVAKDKIEWTLTVIDPDTWTKPWTYGMQLTQDPEQVLFEYACHEGNYAMRNILSAGRAADAEAAKSQGR
jgi:hypothetical protein